MMPAMRGTRLTSKLFFEGPLCGPSVKVIDEPSLPYQQECSHEKLAAKSAKMYMASGQIAFHSKR